MSRTRLTLVALVMTRVPNFGTGPGTRPGKSPVFHSPMKTGEIFWPRDEIWCPPGDKFPGPETLRLIPFAPRISGQLWGVVFFRPGISGRLWGTVFCAPVFRGVFGEQFFVPRYWNGEPRGIPGISGNCMQFFLNVTEPVTVNRVSYQI